MKRARVFALMIWIMAIASPGALVAGDRAGDQADESGEDSALDWRWKAQPVEGESNEIDLVLTAGIRSGWILYSSDFESVDFGPRAAKLVVVESEGQSVGELRAIGAASRTDKNFAGEYSYRYFAGHAEFRQRVRLSDGARTVGGLINGQTCFEESGLCTLFRQRFSVALP